MRHVHFNDLGASRAITIDGHTDRFPDGRLGPGVEVGSDADPEPGNRLIKLPEIIVYGSDILAHARAVGGVVSGDHLQH